MHGHAHPHACAQDESVAMHSQRVAEAKQARLDAEAELRMLFYLDALDPGVEEVLATYDFHAALARVSMQVRRRAHQPDSEEP